ncbi:hypothetical protein [Pseudomonas sp. CGJS7]|uniref:hypothetical protein n=1 Tax=Pseudomonas sp. CGJS7 TaxID=3109348 RepID=UPI00300A7D06
MDVGPRKLAAMAKCGAAFLLAFLAFLIGKKEGGFWHWVFAKEAVARSRNRCMAAFLINDAYKRGFYHDVLEAYALFKDTVDVFDAKGDFRGTIAHSRELTRCSGRQ